jgi:hypothetical protein
MSSTEPGPPRLDPLEYHPSANYPEVKPRPESKVFPTRGSWALKPGEKAAVREWAVTVPARTPFDVPP